MVTVSWPTLCQNCDCMTYTLDGKCESVERPRYE